MVHTSITRSPRTGTLARAPHVTTRPVCARAHTRRSQCHHIARTAAAVPSIPVPTHRCSMHFRTHSPCPRARVCGTATHASAVRNVCTKRDESLRSSSPRETKRSACRHAARPRSAAGRAAGPLRHRACAGARKTLTRWTSPARSSWKFWPPRAPSSRRARSRPSGARG